MHRITLAPRVLAATLAAALVATLTVASAQIERAGALPGANGSSPSQAAASCWAIKQDHPSSADGLYYLQTPTLVRPQQFYCDMTTDGGGWVLVGRGRENWTFHSAGQGSAWSVRTNPTGTAAFSPAALPSSTIDGLLDGAPVKDLPDGVRVRRSLNSAGTQYQEMRLDFESLDSWSWGFGGGYILDDVTIDGEFFDGSNTADTRANYGGQTVNELNGINDQRRMVTRLWSFYGWKMGFAYGGAYCGATSSASSYLFDGGGTGCSGQPFTQVWVRPMLTEADLTYEPIPAGGTPADTIAPLLANKPATTSWGVSSLGTSYFWDRHEVEVWAFAEIGSTIYVGGKFAFVRDNAASQNHDQPYLAAFDRDTGVWISTFAPEVEGAVYDLHALPDGRLAVAGEFTDVNGEPGTHGLAVLDATTGDVDTTWISDIHKLNGNRVLVNDLDVEGNHLYAVGDFEEVQRNNGEPDLRVWRIARFDVTTGEVDWTWRPSANFEVIALDATPDRTYFAGRFAAVNNSPGTANFAAVSTVDGSTIPGLDPFVPSASQSYQQMVARYGDRVFVGGSEHNFWTMDAADHSLLEGHITKQGGDYQAISEIAGIVYASCHCNQWNYQGSYDWPTASGYNRVDKINYVVAHDAVTGEILPEFMPDFYVSSFNEGPWETFADSQDCLWVGGDLARGGWNGSGYDWLGGFGRFCPRDTTAPATPGSFNVTLTDDDVLVSYAHAQDDNGAGVTYEILRDDRVIGHIGGRYFSDPDITGTHTYAVRSVDAAGNRSASTVPISVTYTPPASALETPIAAGSTWIYDDSGVEPTVDWTVTTIPGASTGDAEFGWGDGDETTLIADDTNMALFQQAFTPTTLASATHAVLRLKYDDGIVVYLNGVEVFRSNISGAHGEPVGLGTYANGYVFGTAESQWTEVTLPTALFSGGTDFIAVGLFQPSTSNVDASFDAELSLFGDTGDSTAPSTPDPEINVIGATDSTVEWAAVTDDDQVTMLSWDLLNLDTSTVDASGWLPGDATSLELTGLTPATDYAIEVTAHDGNGNTALGSEFWATAGDPTVIAADHTWNYAYTDDDLGNWMDVGFDDSAWASGPAELGFGDGDEATVIGTSGQLVAYFRTTVELSPATFSSIDLDVIRDDGVIVYVNGVEVGRDNLPAGPVDHTTYASTSVWGAAESTPVSFSVPSSSFVEGTNTIAIAVHQDWRGSPDLSFQATARTR